MIKDTCHFVPSLFDKLYFINQSLKKTADDLETMAKKAERMKSPHHMAVSLMLDVLEIICLYGDSPKMTIEHHDFTKLKTDSEWGRMLIKDLMADEDLYKHASDWALFYWDGKLIGGSSPFSLVYPCQDAGSKDIQLYGCKGNRLFGDECTLLGERGEIFQSFMMKILVSYRDKIPKDLQLYLERSSILMKDLTAKACFTFSPTISDKTVVSINGIPLTATDQDIIRTSDCILKISKPFFTSDTLYENTKEEERKIQAPLLLSPQLPTYMRYCMQINWDSKFLLDEKDKETPIDMRTLPGTGIRHPYLTIEDLLEDHIFHIDGIDPEKFVSDQDFLPPLKRAFFMFFTPQDASKFLFYKITTEGILVKLLLSVGKADDEGIVIVLSKFYDKKHILEIQPNIGIFPLIKTPKDFELPYRLLTEKAIQPICFDESKHSCQILPVVQEETDSYILWSVKKPFEIITFQAFGEEVLLIPIFREVNYCTKSIVYLYDDKVLLCNKVSSIYIPLYRLNKEMEEMSGLTNKKYTLLRKVLTDHSIEGETMLNLQSRKQDDMMWLLLWAIVSNQGLPLFDIVVLLPPKNKALEWNNLKARLCNSYKKTMPQYSYHNEVKVEVVSTTKAAVLFSKLLTPYLNNAVLVDLSLDDGYISYMKKTENGITQISTFKSLSIVDFLGIDYSIPTSSSPFLDDIRKLFETFIKESYQISEQERQKYDNYITEGMFQTNAIAFIRCILEFAESESFLLQLTSIPTFRTKMVFFLSGLLYLVKDYLSTIQAETPNIVIIYGQGCKLMETVCDNQSLLELTHAIFGVNDRQKVKKIVVEPNLFSPNRPALAYDSLSQVQLYFQETYQPYYGYDELLNEGLGIKDIIKLKDRIIDQYYLFLDMLEDKALSYVINKRFGLRTAFFLPDRNNAQMAFMSKFNTLRATKAPYELFEMPLFFWPASSFFAKSLFDEEIKTPKQKETDYYDVFISYRRKDAGGREYGTLIARQIYLAIKQNGYNPFFDYSECTDGEFQEKIIPAVRRSRYFLLILTEHALDRCVYKKDWVRREIKEAVESGCKIIPVNPDDQFKDYPQNLPKFIKDVLKLQFSEINMKSLFEASIRNMIEKRFNNS